MPNVTRRSSARRGEKKTPVIPRGYSKVESGVSRLGDKFWCGQWVTVEESAGEQASAFICLIRKIPEAKSSRGSKLSRARNRRPTLDVPPSIINEQATQLHALREERDGLKAAIKVAMTELTVKEQFTTEGKAKIKAKERIKRALRTLEDALDPIGAFARNDGDRIAANIAKSLAKRSPYVEILERTTNEE